MPKQNSLSFKKNLKGFTLIELLVVITIIGLLITIVFVNVRSSQIDAKDAAIKEAFFTLRSRVEVSFSETGNYDAVCDADTLSDAGDFGMIENNIEENNKSGQEVKCYTDSTPNSTEYVAWTQLIRGNYWCIDSKLTSREVTSEPNISSVEIFCP